MTKGDERIFNMKIYIEIYDLDYTLYMHVLDIYLLKMCCGLTDAE